MAAERAAPDETVAVVFPLSVGEGFGAPPALGSATDSDAVKLGEYTELLDGEDWKTNVRADAWTGRANCTNVDGSPLAESRISSLSVSSFEPSYTAEQKDGDNAVSARRIQVMLLSSPWQLGNPRSAFETTNAHRALCMLGHRSGSRLSEALGLTQAPRTARSRPSCCLRLC